MESPRELKRAIEDVRSTPLRSTMPTYTVFLPTLGGVKDPAMA